MMLKSTMRRGFRGWRLVPAALVLTLGLVAGTARAQTAGTVQFVSGQALVRASSGQTRAVARGDAVASGETIQTDNGRVQMRMVDGAFISLQPQTQLVLSDYRLASTGSEEHGFMALVRGGLRTISGAIGKVNRSNYRLTTPTATVGIRGTEFAVLADNGTRVSVTQGLVAMCNDGGCVDVGAGQSGFTPNTRVRPSLVFTPASLPPVASPPLQAFVVADQRTASGASDVLSPLAGGASQMPVIPLANGAGGGGIASVANGGGFTAGLLGSTLTFNSAGALTSGIDCCLSSNSYTSGVPADFGADGIIAWGRWTDGYHGTTPLAGMNYVVALTSSGFTGTSIVHGYASFASTAPVVADSSGNIIATGTPNSVTGMFNVNFTNPSSGGSVTYQLNIPVASQTFTVTGSAGQYGMGFLGTSSTITSTGSACTPSCAGNIPYGDAIQGIITGATGSRLGANYGFTSQIGEVTGAVVAK